MKVLILDGTEKEDLQGELTVRLLREELDKINCEITYELLREKKIAPCKGNFYCWLKTPGVCIIPDDSRAIAKKMIESDLTVFLTPVKYGGFSSTLKNTVDHLIQNISPLFATINGETHHRKRYGKYPDILALGWSVKKDDINNAVFQHYIERMSINIYSKNHAVEVFNANQNDSEIRNKITNLLENIREGRSTPNILLPTEQTQSLNHGNVKKVSLLVGSPRKEKSSSYMLGSYLMDQLADNNIETEYIMVNEVVKNGPESKMNLNKIVESDLLVLAFPLYVDSLPGNSVRALDVIAEHITDDKPRGLAAIINCGFPEPEQNLTASAICASFARLNGYKWLGSLLLGGGQGMVRCQPLDQQGAKVSNIKKSLQITATALKSGNSIPPEAIKLMGSKIIPYWLYRMMGGIGVRMRARKNGTSANLNYLAGTRV